MPTISAWKFTYSQFQPAKEHLKEALCTLGNGYFATRGTIPEALASKVHYPGTYISGLYNRLSTHIVGKTVFNEDIVNCPNWIFFTFKIGNGEWFYPSPGGILSYHQELDMQRGVLSRRVRFQNHKGQRTLIETRRIVSMADPHFAAIEYTITPENYSDWITVRTMLDGTVLNIGVERYRELNCKHWKFCALGSFIRNGIFLSMKTSQSDIEVVEASKLRIFTDDKEIRPAIKSLKKARERIGQEFKMLVRKKNSYKIEKTVSMYTSKDEGIHMPIKPAIESVQNARRFKSLLLSHEQAWDKLWKRFDIHIEGDPVSQGILRMHIFHLLQTASIHNIKIDSGFPARGLHGEAYRGHVFWDEIFIMPFYDLHMPEVSKALLLYRYRRLCKAQEAAKAKAYKGAMFPWQSASTGREETQVIHLNPMSGTWGPDYSFLQRHVSFAIAYNAWQYYKRTGDIDFLLYYGAEMILSIAQFGSSLAKYDAKDKRYHTEGLVGPDEFHESFPGMTKPGLKDNAYTNFMIVWTLLKAQELLAILPGGQKVQLLRKLKLEQEDIRRWDDITHKMNIIINSDGVIGQFDGYFRLKELDWARYKEQYGNIRRMDRILKAEGESPDDYKVAKQADVLMFFFLLGLDEIENIFKRLGYPFDKNMLRKNFDYYLQRTSHGSTLSKVVFCFLAQLLEGPKDSWPWFKEVLNSDIQDIQNETTPEGIHAGIMAGSIDIVMRGYAGISTLEDIIRINPNLPKNWQRMKLRFRYKNRWVSLSITKQQLTILIQGPATKVHMVPVEVNGKLYRLPLGKASKVSLKTK